MSASSSENNVIDQLAEEFLNRFRRGERPSMTEYTSAHPELADRIRQLFPAIVFAEQMGGPQPETQTRPAAPMPDYLGDYHIIREIGHGGMGIVYEAVQESLGRHVALKVLPHGGLANPTFRERFQREARAAARMHHSNIVPVFGVGEHNGIHYYAMQYIDGQGLDTILREIQRMRGQAVTKVGPAKTPGTPLATEVAQALHHGAFQPSESTSGSAASTSKSRTPTLSTRSDSAYFRSIARIGLQVAQGLEYAHRQGILHRDIKPSNLLMDALGTVWITDFGLAKADDDAELTHTGDFVGTIRYMAPERFRGESTATGDVYALGITLYEMLTLRPAFLESDRARLLEQVVRDSPPSPRKIDQNIPRDLETIVIKAISKEPSRRYKTADQLADDLQRFLSDRPVQARRASWREKTWLWCRRNPRVAVLAGLASLLLLVILIGSPIMSLRLYEQRQSALEELWNADVARAKAQRMAQEPGRRWLGLASLDHARSLLQSLKTDPRRIDDLRNEFIACLSLSDLQQQLVRSGYPAGSAAVCFDTACERYARGDEQGAITIRRLADDSEIGSLPAVGMGAWGLKFSPDGRFLAVGYHRRNRFTSEHFRVWDWQSRKEILVVNSQTGCGEADFSHDSKLVAFGKDEDQLAIHDLGAAGAPGRTFKVGALPTAIAFHRDGKRLAVATGKNIELRNIETGEVGGKRTQFNSVWTLAWHPDGTQLFFSVGQNIYVVDNMEDATPVVLRGHEAVIYALTISHDGQRLASKAHDGTVRLWDLNTRLQLIRTPSIYTGCTPIGFGPDDRLLGYASNGQQLWYWQVADGAECRALATGNFSASFQSFSCDFSAGSRFVAVGSSHGVHLWDCATGMKLATLPTQSNWGVRFEPDDQSLMTTSRTGLQRWPMSISDGNQIQFGTPVSIGQEGQLQALQVSRDGKVLVSKRSNGPAIIVRLDQPQSPIIIAEHPKLNSIAISPDGERVATGTNFGNDVCLWTSSDGQKLATLTCDSSANVEFSPDGKRLVVATDKDYRFYDMADLQVKLTIAKEPETLPGTVSFTNDGQLMTVRYSPTKLWLMNGITGARIAELHAPNDQILFWHRLSADGSKLAAAGLGGIIHLWDLRKIREQLAQRGLDW